MLRRILFLYVGDKQTGALESLLALATHLPETSYEIMIASPKPGFLSERLAGTKIKVRFAALKTWTMIKEDYWLGLKQQKLPWVQQKYREWVQFFRFLFSLAGQHMVIRRLNNEFQPDILHLNGISLIAAGIAGSYLNIPMVWQVNSIMANNIWAAIARAIISRNSTAIVCISKSTAAPFKQAQPKIHVVNNPVDADRFCPADSRNLRMELGIPDNTVCVGYIGRFSHAKGVFDLLDAAPAILAGEPKVRFLMVGYGTPDIEAQIKERIASSGLEEYFHLTGVRKDIPAVLSTLDIMISPSWSEGANRTVIEAMAMRKPVVATNIPAITELIDHGKSGLLVSPNHSDELAAAVLDFIKNPRFAAECGIAGYHTFHERYNLQSSIQTIDNLYTAIIQQRTG